MRLGKGREICIQTSPGDRSLWPLAHSGRFCEGGSNTPGSSFGYPPFMLPQGFVSFHGQCWGFHKDAAFSSSALVEAIYRSLCSALNLVFLPALPTGSNLCPQCPSEPHICPMGLTPAFPIVFPASLRNKPHALVW